MNDGVSPCYIEVGDLRRTTSYNERVLTEKISSYCLSEYAAEAMHDFRQSQLSYDPSLNGSIFLPRYIPLVSELAGLYERVFPPVELDTAHDYPEFFRSRAILTPFNDVAMEMNSELLNRMHADIHLRLVENTADVQDPTLQEYSTESLQGIQLAGLPLSTLALKIGAPVMLLRNLDQASRLNNGSRMIFLALDKGSLRGICEAVIMMASCELFLAFH